MRASWQFQTADSLESISEDSGNATQHADCPGLGNDRFVDDRFGGGLRLGARMAALLPVVRLLSIDVLHAIDVRVGLR
jgi:hypothetical protein